GSLSGTLAEAAGDQLQWTIPMDFCAQLPNATSGTVQISCSTYNGSEYVGNAVIYVTLTVLPSVVPAIGAVQLRPVNDLAALDGVYVKGFSKAGYTVTASAPYGASVTACNVTLGSVSGGGTSRTTGVLTAAGTLIPAVTVKDSRGRTATRALDAITVEDYFLSSVFGFSARRCTENGTDSDSGTYLKIACTANCAAAGGRNSAALRARYCASSGAFNGYTAITGPTAILGGDLEVNRSYTVEVSATDTLGGSAAVTENIATAAVTVNIREGRKGIGVGKYAESDALEVALPAAFLAALQVGGVDLNGIRDFITETGSSGVWTYIKLKSGIKLCWTVYTFTADVNYAVGGSYYSQNYFGGGAFPSEFFTQDPVQLPVLQEASATAISLQTSAAGNCYTTGSWYFSRPVAATGVTGKVAVLAIGR
ncbi:MAG: DUF859 family phage minor structural protein, partial [Oscillibacter sp.]|nr:DUF859 family phage minor structural protein [Oscillibacter sp.]